jgi:hypothetical protein|tara:strand:- start:31 stop:300 length:270 start_codon:yes stop_codon:yes gene_type:complete
MAKKKEDEFDFELDEDDKIDEYASEVNLILTVLGEIDQDLANSVLTNSTKFVDFDLSNEEMDQIVQAVGLVVKHDDNIIDIAKKLRDNA